MVAGSQAPAIETQGLSRHYLTSTGIVRQRKISVAALSDVSLSIDRGEIFGMVGPNGAGKTTLIKVLTTLLLPSGGTARVLGLDVSSQPQEIRRRINFLLGGERGLYWRLSAWDNMLYFADLYRLPVRQGRVRARQLLETVGLWDRKDERVEGFSKGMKQRLHLAKSMINAPEVLFLDEPSIGLDPVAARHLRELIQRLRQEVGTTILLTSHYMWEMETLSDRIAVLVDGRVRHLDTPAGLRGQAVGTHVVEVVMTAEDDEGQVRAELTRHGSVLVHDEGSRRLLEVHTSTPQAVVETLTSGRTEGVVGHLVRESQLEDAYVFLVGNT